MRRVDSRGYVRISVPKSVAACCWVYEHRLVVEAKLGRPLERGEVVHHRNGDKADNDPANLELMAIGEHVAEHNRLSPKRPKGIRYPGDIAGRPKWLESMARRFQQRYAPTTSPTTRSPRPKSATKGGKANRAGV